MFVRVDQCFLSFHQFYFHRHKEQMEFLFKLSFMALTSHNLLLIEDHHEQRIETRTSGGIPPVKTQIQDLDSCEAVSPHVAIQRSLEQYRRKQCKDVDLCGESI